MTERLPERWKDVLEYWFGKPEETKEYFNSRNKLWFGAAEKTDEHIRAHFAKDVESASRGEISAWEDQPESCLALILLLDQFSMNMERDTRRCYERSSMSIPIAERAIASGFDRQVHISQRVFFYLPLEHSESLSHQRKGIELFQQMTLDYPAAVREKAEGFLRFAVLHFEVIEKFGRFPGRNELFGRKSTEEEKRYLDEGGWL